jgi:hypothetical protein
MITKKVLLSLSFLALISACSRSDDSSKTGSNNASTNQASVNQEILGQIAAKKAALLEKVATCGWKSAPESAGYFLGMTIPEAKAFASSNGYQLSCRESAPITAGSVTEMVQKMLNDEFTVSRDFRASQLCETKVEGNNVSLYFFKATPDGEPLLAKAYNSLDSFRKNSPMDTYSGATPVMEALSEKYGFNIDKSNSCSVDAGNGFTSNFSITFARPYPDRMPGQPNISLFFTATNDPLIRLGGAITKQRDDAAEANQSQAEKDNLRNKASKL